MSPSNDPLAELAAAMESSMRCTDAHREKSWRETQGRVRLAANDDGFPASAVIDAVPEITRRTRTISRRQVAAYVLVAGLAAGLVLGFIGRGLYARSEPLAKVEPEASEAARLTRVQGALLVQYLDAQDLICDAVVEEMAHVASDEHTTEPNVTEGERSKAAAFAREGRAARRAGDFTTARRLLEAALRVNLSLQCAYDVDGVHVYVDVPNALTLLGKDAERDHKKVLRFIHIMARVAHLVFQKTDAVKVDTGPSR